MTTTPFEPKPPHQKLTALAGTWAGTTLTWLDPSAPPSESRVDASVETLLGGRWIRIAYASTVMEKPHAGEMTVGFHNDAKAHEMTWIDSFHTGTSIMLSTGAPRDDGAVSVLGSYAAGPQRWGWRTVIHQPSSGELVIEAFNIAPSGEEFPAVTTKLTRRA
ncbi:MAG: DUF1579 domain-containing protein [Labilithrix sp.]|nr:DUF1579 domain-containing protein [Labilithrix sp.]